MLNERSKIKQKTPNNEGNRSQYSRLYKRVKIVAEGTISQQNWALRFLDEIENVAVH